MENEKLGIEKTVAILKSVKTLVVAAKSVMADGKVNLADLPVAISLLSQISAIAESAKGFSGAVKEAKDLEQSEVLALVNEVYSLVAAIEAA